MRRYSCNDSSAWSASTLTLGCTTAALKPAPLPPSAAARSPLASTSTPRTSRPRRAARRQSAAATVVLPVPPLPATKTMRRSSRSSSRPAGKRVPGRSDGRADRLEHLGGVTGGLDGAPLTLHLAVLADEEGAPLDALVGAPVHRFLDPQPERLDEHVVRVADQ